MSGTKGKGGAAAKGGAKGGAAKGGARPQEPPAGRLPLDLEGLVAGAVPGDQEARPVDLVHHLVAGVDAQAAADAVEL